MELGLCFCNKQWSSGRPDILHSITSGRARSFPWALPHLSWERPSSRRMGHGPCYHCGPPHPQENRETLFSVFLSPYLIFSDKCFSTFASRLPQNNEPFRCQPAERYQGNSREFTTRCCTCFQALSGVQDHSGLGRGQRAEPLGEKLVRITGYNLPRPLLGDQTAPVKARRDFISINPSTARAQTSFLACPLAL